MTAQKQSEPENERKKEAGNAKKIKDHLGLSSTAFIPYTSQGGCMHVAPSKDVQRDRRVKKETGDGSSAYVYAKKKRKKIFRFGSRGRFEREML